MVLLANQSDFALQVLDGRSWWRGASRGDGEVGVEGMPGCSCDCHVTVLIEYIAIERLQTHRHGTFIKMYQAPSPL